VSSTDGPLRIKVDLANMSGFWAQSRHSDQD
jgi:hypothetical protein